MSGRTQTRARVSPTGQPLGTWPVSALLFLVALLSFIPNPAWAQAPQSSIDLSRMAPIENATPYVFYAIDEGATRDISDVIRPGEADRFRAVDQVEPNFGFEKDPVWLRLRLENPTGQRQERILLFRTNFVSEIDVWQWNGAALERLLSQTVASPFDTRPIDFHQLAVPVALEPTESATIFVRYRTSGLTALPTSLETPVSFAERASRGLATDFAFYGIMSVLLIASLIALATTRASIFLWYFLYAGSVTFYIFHRDGYAFQFLWRDHGLWNSYASVPIAALMTSFAAQFTRAYLASRDGLERFNIPLLSVIGLHAALLVLSIVWDSEATKQVMTVSIPLSAILFLAAGVSVWRRHGTAGLAFVLGWSGIVLASAVTFIAHWVDMAVTRDATLGTMRLAMVFDSTMMGLACIHVLLGWRRERERLLTERVTVAEYNADLRRRISSLESRYQEAETAIRSSSRQIADTSHDMRQPLFALRAALVRLNASEAPDKTELGEIEASLDYMERLIEDGLAPSRADQSHTAHAHAVGVDQLFAAVKSIHRADAEQLGVTLRFGPTTATLHGDTGAVLRVLCNSVGNALEHAQASKILVGVRRRRGHLLFEVFDNGRGFEPDRQAAEARDHDESRSATRGRGLAIVSEILSRLDGSVTIDSVAGRGTRIAMLVPNGTAIDQSSLAVSSKPSRTATESSSPAE